MSFHFSLKDFLEYFLKVRSANNEFFQVLFFWECPDLWRTVFLDMDFWAWRSLSFSLLSMCSHCLCPRGLCGSLACDAVTPLFLLGFSYSLWRCLSNLIVVGLYVLLFELILLGIQWTSWMCRWVFFVKLGEFLAIISSSAPPVITTWRWGDGLDFSLGLI